MEAVKSLVRPVLRAAKDGYARTIGERPSARYRDALARAATSPDFLRDAARLCDDGVVILPNYFSREVVQRMAEDFDRFARVTKPDKDHMVHVSSKCFTESAELSRSAVEPYLTSLVSYYWGKPIVLAQAAGYRLLAVEPFEHGGWRWHHDAIHKQIKIMILFTDVHQGGQRMEYLRGTHTEWRPTTEYDSTRFRPEDVAHHGEPLQCVGKAGTAVIFDTNGLHRGNRSKESVRDIWYNSYTAGASVYPMASLHPDVVRGLTQEQRRIARNCA